MRMHKFPNSLMASLAAAVFILGCGTRKPTDAQITTNLKAQMFSDPQTKTADLQVAVKNGVVTLSGAAPSDAARYEAYKLAVGTSGVTKVNDEMTVQPPQQTVEATSSSSPTAPAEAPPASTVTEARSEPKLRSHKKHHSRTADAIQSGRNTGDKTTESANPTPPATTPAVTAAPVPAVQQSATEKSEAAPPAQPTAPPPSQTTAAPQPSPRSETAIFPVGTTVEVQTVDPIDSKTGQAGDEFQATLAQPLTWNSHVIVPKGASIYLRLVAVQTSGQYKGRSELQLRLVRLEFQGAEYHLNSSTYTEAGSSRGKNTAEKVGGGALLGAIIGAIAGGGKGAVIGGTVGAAGGGVYQGVSKAKQIRIPAEAILDFKLDEPLNIPVSPGDSPQ